jgi:2',5'-phosphodiesterase
MDGNMGILIAIPLSSYKILNVDVSRLSTTATAVTLDTEQHQIVESIVDQTSPDHSFTRDSLDEEWSAACSRKNSMITVELECKASGVPFVVGTYHMPCMFVRPRVMTIHCSLAAQQLQRLAKDKPYILAGDFNITPNSMMYRLLTEQLHHSDLLKMPCRVLSEEAVKEGQHDNSGTTETHSGPASDLVNSTNNLKPQRTFWAPVLEPMRSAYVLANGIEPDFTNHAKMKQNNLFTDTLDYIFVSKHWKISNVTPLPHRNDLPGPLPTEHEPSDHLMIAAHLEIHGDS